MIRARLTGETRWYSPAPGSLVFVMREDYRGRWLCVTLRWRPFVARVRVCERLPLEIALSIGVRRMSAMWEPVLRALARVTEQMALLGEQFKEVRRALDS